jgi:hypothetical protein
MPKQLKFSPEWSAKRQQYEHFEDFLWDQSDLFFIDTVTDSGTAAVGDAVNGVMVLTPSDGTVGDNDEVYLASANELFKFAADQPFMGSCRLQFTETASGVYNAAFGFANAVAADLIVDNGAGLRTTGSVLAIYKVDGGTVWKAVSRVNNVAMGDSTSTTTAGGTNYQELEIEVTPIDSTRVQAVYKVGDIIGPTTYLTDATTGLPIVHTITVASSTEMQIFVGAKLGAITNNDVLNVDYIRFAASRVN